MSIEVMKLALEALENSIDMVRHEYEADWRHGIPTRKAQLDVMKQALDEHESAIADLRQAIDDAQKQEPVAWMVYTLDGQSVCVTDNPTDFTPEHRALPLYTSPPQRQPLTENEIKHLWYEACQTNLELTSQLIVHLARAIEAAHGITGEKE